MKILYRNTVMMERETFLHIVGSEIIPRCYEFLKTTKVQSKSAIIKEYSQQFVQVFERVIQKQKLVKEWNKTDELPELSDLRHEINLACDVVNEALQMIPKKDTWPEFEDFIHIYE